MKVIGICGSPRKGGNTELMIKNALKRATEVGANTALILSSERKIELCDGCLECENTGKCHIKDDMQEIYRKILDCDAIIFSSPVYWNNVTPQMKNFIDRMNPIASKLTRKIIGVILVGQCKGREKEESHKIAIKWFKDLSRLYHARFAGIVDASARLPKDIMKHKTSLVSAIKLGEKIAKM